MRSLNGTRAPLRRLRLIGLIATSVAVAIASVGIGMRLLAQSSLAERTEEQAVPTLTIVRPDRGAKAQELVLPGDVQAYIEAPIYARVNGYLKRWTEDIGARVANRQLLAEIDTPDLDQQLQQAEADLAAAQANDKLASVTTKRWHALLASDSVSQQDADEKAGDAEAKKAGVAAAEANVNRLLALESFKRIVAPFDGVVTARETDVGALINSGSGTGPELFRVADIHKVRIYVRVPQALSGSLWAGQKAELHLPQDPGRIYEAEVTTSAHAINASSRTLLVELQGDNPQGELAPGTYAEVHFKLAADVNLLRLPASALLFRENGLEVATVGPQGTVALKRIEIGRDLGKEVEIASGLDPADRVIDSPPDSLAQGDRIRPVEADAVADGDAQSPEPGAASP